MDTYGEKGTTMTRDEHMAWCKKRALEYLDAGDITNAVTSMMSDLSKHPETAKVGEMMGSFGLLCAMQQDYAGARRFIVGFN